MTPADILAALAANGAALRLVDGKLRVSPRAALTPDIREAIREQRGAVEAEYRRRMFPFLSEVMDAFSGSVVVGHEIEEGDRPADHIPAKVRILCRSPRLHGDCRCDAWTPDQLLSGISLRRLDTQGCGDCLTCRAGLQSKRIQEREAKKAATRRAAEKANREAIREMEERD